MIAFGEVSGIEDATFMLQKIHWYRACRTVAGFHLLQRHRRASGRLSGEEAYHLRAGGEGGWIKWNCSSGHRA